MIVDDSRRRKVGFSLLAAVAMSLFSSGWVMGEEAVSRPEEGGSEERLVLAELIQEALENSPEILAARQSWEAARARPSQASSLPDPEISFGLTNIGTNYSVGRQDMSTLGGSFTQRIPFPGKLALRARVAQREAEREEAMYQSVRLSVLSRLKVAYHDLYFAYQSIDLIGQSKAWLEELEKAAEARYAVGRGIQQDVLRAQVEVSRFLQQLELWEARKEALKAKVNALLNRPPDAPLGRPAELERSRLTGTLAELSERALENSPRLNADERSIAQREASLALARKEYLPDLSLNGGFFYRGELREMWQAYVGLSIPLYFRTKQEYGVREAQASLRGAYRGQEATRQALLSQLKELYVEATTAQRVAELFRSGIIPQATLSLESAQAGYQVGKVDFLTVLDNLVRLLSDELSYHEEVIKFEKAIAQIDEVTGKE